jgi:hypothetical protein
MAAHSWFRHQKPVPLVTTPPLTGNLSVIYITRTRRQSQLSSPFLPLTNASPQPGPPFFLTNAIFGAIFLLGPNASPYLRTQATPPFSFSDALVPAVFCMYSALPLQPPLLMPAPLLSTPLLDQQCAASLFGSLAASMTMTLFPTPTNPMTLYRPFSRTWRLNTGQPERLPPQQRSNPLFSH